MFASTNANHKSEPQFSKVPMRGERNDRGTNKRSSLVPKLRAARCPRSPKHQLLRSFGFIWDRKWALTARVLTSVGVFFVATDQIWGVPGRFDFETTSMRDGAGDNVPRVGQINTLRSDDFSLLV